MCRGDSPKGSHEENMVDFIQTHIIFRYGVPRYIVIHDVKPFVNKLMTNLCEKFKFTQHKPPLYNVLAKCLAKAFNKTLCNLL